MARIESLLDPRYEHRILGLMLVCLHLSVWGDIDGPLARSLMLAHLGLFLLWQPLWSRQQKLELGSGLACFRRARAALLSWQQFAVP